MIPRRMTRGPGYQIERERVLALLSHNSGPRVLAALANVPGGGLATSLELAAATGLNRSTVQTVLSRGIYVSLVERVNQSRWVGYRLTQAGCAHTTPPTPEETR